MQTRLKPKRTRKKKRYCKYGLLIKFEAKIDGVCLNILNYMATLSGQDEPDVAL